MYQEFIHNRILVKTKTLKYILSWFIFGTVKVYAVNHSENQCETLQ